MKIKCAHCGGLINSKCNYCNLCGESTYKQRSRRGMIVIGGIVVFLIV